MARRAAVTVRGVVQGVGFRPFVYRLALAQRLGGWVRNTGDSVHIEIEGESTALESFFVGLRRQAPLNARVEQVEVRELAPTGETSFRIEASKVPASVRPAIPADLATCGACAAEVSTPGERRHRYPFTNCTHCGPRFTIVESVPYDRPRTSMKAFPLCPECEAEYRDPLDRRFHAQPIACPRCGPQLRLLDAGGAERARGDAALTRAAAELLDGRIVALKGLGGFQLLVDATADEAVRRLRQRKQREEKPFAVMFPSLAAMRACCRVSEAEAEHLTSSAAPILLVERRLVPGEGVVSDASDSALLCPGVAPGNPYLGVLLPYTPLHRLLLEACRRPLVCTSGNLSEEPMCIEESEALERLGSIADLFLVHDRPIIRPMDDSVARVGERGLELWRRARGFAPLPLRVNASGPNVLALGGQLKSTVALLRGGEAVVSQHLGDLHSLEAVNLLERTVEDFLRFFDFRPELVACDLHPDYASTRLAERLARERGWPVEHVQHHHAHVAVAMAEHGLDGQVLGMAWDGTGWGTDGTVWGGEWLACDGAAFARIARLRPFRLPGGEQAIREPRRAALGLLHAFAPAEAERWAARWFGVGEARVLLALLAGDLQAPWTSSMGRLFDAVAAMAGLRTHNRFEGQAAMELEFAAAAAADDEAGSYAVALQEDALPGAAARWTLDWAPLVRGIIDDVDRGQDAARVSARFHRALVDVSVALARRAALERIVLGGGCWQNQRLVRQVRAGLERAGFRVYAPERVPTNDGGISLGQALVASRRQRKA